MELVALLEMPAKLGGQQFPDRGLAGARNAHDHDDHRPVVSGMLVH
jgi:hypothetical protein